MNLRPPSGSQQKLQAGNGNETNNNSEQNSNYQPFIDEDEQQQDDQPIPQKKGLFQKTKNTFNALKGRLGGGKKSNENESLGPNSDENLNVEKKKGQTFAQKLQSKGQQAFNVVNKKYIDQKRQINVKVKKQQENIILKGLSFMKPKVKKKVEDPFLYKPLRNMVDEIFEENWALVVEEVQFQFRMREMEPYIEVDREPSSILGKFRAKFNYTILPYDKSIGKQLRDWRFVFLQMLSVTPYGVQAAYYLINFLCIDKTDEFQLIYFILDYKKMQWLSSGIFLGVMGYYKFFHCAALTPEADKDLIYEKCSQHGPGSDQNVHIQLIQFLTNIVLIWFCMFLLPFSKQKGQPKFRVVEDLEGLNQLQVEKDERPKGCCTCLNWDRGGKLKGLMLFDLASFVFATLIFVYTYIDLGMHSIEESGQLVQFSRWIYGMLSFPFLLFNVPVFLSLLTHCKKTCYDQNGNCVPPKAERLEEESKTQYQKYFPEQVTNIIDNANQTLNQNGITLPQGEIGGSINAGGEGNKINETIGNANQNSQRKLSLNQNNFNSNNNEIQKDEIQQKSIPSIKQ